MAKSKEQLLKEAKELGLKVNKSMSIYELEHRIKDKKVEIEEEKAKQSGESTAKSPAKVSRRRNGEY